MFAKEKSGVVVEQYVADGSVLVSVDSMAGDNAAAASGFAGTLAPHADTTSDVAARVKSSECCRVIGICVSGCAR
jgi:hypothetical protein